MGFIEEVIDFYGHPSIRATHKTTMELTKDEHLTKRGDCIIGIKASKACIDICNEAKKLLKIPRKRMKIKVIVKDRWFEFEAEGHPRLMLTHPRDIVIRKSDFVCSRTLAVRANAAAIDLPRAMVELLRCPHVKGKMIVHLSY